MGHSQKGGLGIDDLIKVTPLYLVNYSPKM